MRVGVLQTIILCSCVYLTSSAEQSRKRTERDILGVGDGLGKLEFRPYISESFVSERERTGDLNNQNENLRNIENTLLRYFSKGVEVNTDKDRVFNEVEENPYKRELEKDGEEEKEYLNEWLVHMKGGEELAKKAITDLGYEFRGLVEPFDDLYEVAHKQGNLIRKKRETKEITDHINTHDDVVWAEQQVKLVRVKRPAMPDINQVRLAKRMEKKFNDPLWQKQWYLFDTRTRSDLPELHLAVIKAWELGYTGKGIKVSVVDDGLETTHPDLVQNYNAEISYDVNDMDDDPTPRYDSGDTNSHGTSCAGEIAMKANNKLCGVGIAHGADIGGIRVLDGLITDKKEALAFMKRMDKTDIFSSSWGPRDNGQSLDGPSRATKLAFEKGIEKGREGKGIIYVWAGGNGGGFQDNCNCDGYTSSKYTISIGSAAQTGLTPFYAEACSSTVATTYSSGAYTDQKIATTALRKGCTDLFTGTSAAAPLAAGIIALALEANNNMSWRDMQHAVIKTSVSDVLKHNDNWVKNGKGLPYHYKFGFGLMNATALVLAAKGWTSVPDQQKLVIPIDATSNGGSKVIKKGQPLIVKFTNNDEKIVSLEHVELVTTISHTYRGMININITSPQGTETTVLTVRPKDYSSTGFSEWPFMSVMTWGENPKGTWTLKITDHSPTGSSSGTLDRASLHLYGTSAVPKHLQ